MMLSSKDTGAEEGKVDYASYTVAELKSVAENKGITIKSTMKKADLIAAIVESEA